MALNAYLRIEGERGMIEGSVSEPGREGLIAVRGFVHNISSPRDAASGLPTGKRQHSPLSITKPLDKASPLLFDTLTSNGTVEELRLELWRLSSTGREEHYYTYEFVGATISSIRVEQLNNQYSENEKHEIREHISFCYQRIVVSSEEGGTTATDTWESA